MVTTGVYGTAKARANLGYIYLLNPLTEKADLCATADLEGATALKEAGAADGRAQGIVGSAGIQGSIQGLNAILRHLPPS